MPKVAPANKVGSGAKVGAGKPAPPGGKVGGAKSLPAPKPPPAPGSPPPAGAPAGSPTPVINPFMTAEDIMAYAEARKAYDSGLAQLDFDYATGVANTGYEKEQITKGAIQGKDDTNWDAAGRGLYRSSIRDADLFDIDATAEMRKRFLDTQLDTLKLNTEAQKHALDSYWNDPETGYLHGLEMKKVQNAQAASAGLPASEPPPPPGTGSSPGSTGSNKVNQPAKAFGDKIKGANSPPPKPKNPNVSPSQNVTPKPPKLGGSNKVKGKLN